MIAIIDYGLGNVKAFANLYANINEPFVIAKCADELKSASKIILPGVGSFDYAIDLFGKSGMWGLLNELVQKDNLPVLGICVGMQMMAKFSEEGNCPGFGWIDGEVKKIKFSEEAEPVAVPHMGWNNINPINNKGIMEGLDKNSRFYFLHSYYFSCRSVDSVLATTSYGEEFASVIRRNNIYGVQFHPEKSHKWGVKLLENFARL